MRRIVIGTWTPANQGGREPESVLRGLRLRTAPSHGDPAGDGKLPLGPDLYVPQPHPLAEGLSSREHLRPGWLVGWGFVTDECWPGLGVDVCVTNDVGGCGCCGLGDLIRSSFVCCGVFVGGARWLLVVGRCSTRTRGGETR